MFEKSTAFYNAIYQGKDYAAEAEKLRSFIDERGQYQTLLDVACGTGLHLQHLRTWYQVSGIDLDAGMIAEAQKALPDVNFHVGNMIDFDLGQSFDVVTCLFSSIGYVQTVDAMRDAITNMAKHVNDGGLLIVEPWFPPGFLDHGRVSLDIVNEANLKITRMTQLLVNGLVSELHMHYLIGTRETGIENRQELHKLGLFTHEEMEEAFINAGLVIFHDFDGLTNRGLYIGQK